MSYVYVPPATSQNAQRLADELREVIEQHQRSNPRLSKAEIHQALQLAGRSSGATKSRELVVGRGRGLG